MIRSNRTVTLATAVLALALSNFLPTSARAGDVKSAPELDIEANIAVRFYNKNESMLWIVQRATDQVIRNIQGADAALQNASAKWNGYYNWRNISDSDLYDLTKPMRVPNFFAKDDITALRTASDKFKTNLRNLADASNALTSYFNDSESKSDQGKKYIDARDQLVALIKQTRESLYAYNDVAIKIAQAGETRILQKDSVGPLIVHMREVLDMTDQVTPVIIANKSLIISYSSKAEKTPERQTQAKAAADQLDALSAKISSLIEKYKNDNTDPINAYKNDDAQKTSRRNLDRIYKDLGPDMISEIKEISSSLRSKAVMQDPRRALNIVSALTQEHDEFIKMFNNWSDDGDVAITRGENKSED